VANGIIRTNPIGRYTLWDMRTDVNEVDSALGGEFWDEAAGVNGNATGAGFNVTVTGATGSANTTANATGAGFSVTITGATGTASAATNGNATGDGFNVTITGATGTANTTANATGAGFNVTITGATGSANTTANAAGAGFNVTITGATGTATGTSGGVDGNATGSGFEITVTGANGTATGSGAQAIGISGGFALKKPAKQYKKIREYVETAIEAVGVDELPQNEVDSLESEIIRAVAERQFKEELYMAIYARDLVQVRINDLRQELEDEDDLLLLS